MPLSVGDKLAHYQVFAPLGAGGMGEVYRALTLLQNWTAALKK